jgi:hypothetical protein
MMPNLFIFIVLRRNPRERGGEGGIHFRVNRHGPFSALPVDGGEQSIISPIISIVRQENVILGNEGARVG